jgi:hypothetical protein
MHPARLFFTPLMIVAAEMQNAVDQQSGDFLVQGLPSLFRLSTRYGYRDYHIAQHARRMTWDVRRAGFPHRKGQHVCRAILTSIPTVEASHSLIAHEQDAQLRRGFSDVGKYRPCRPFNMRPIKREPSDLTLHMDRH